MTDYELLSISIACLSALVAMKAIVVSRNTAKEQKHLAQLGFRLEGRNLMATHHGKYADLLHSVEEETKEATDELARAARDAFNKLCSLVDKYNSGESVRPARHLYHEACELIYKSFNYQLVWQRGLNIVSRYRSFRYIESDIGICIKDKSKVIKRARAEQLDFDRLYRIDPNELLERRLLSSAHFALLVDEILNCIPEKDRQILFHKGLVVAGEYRENYNRWIDTINRGHDLLAEGLARNKHEEFPLRESPRLYQKYSEQMAKLEIIKSFSLPDWGDIPVEFSVDSPLSQLIYMGAVIYTVQMYWAWGL